MNEGLRLKEAPSDPGPRGPQTSPRTWSTWRFCGFLLQIFVTDCYQVLVDPALTESMAQWLNDKFLFYLDRV